MTKLNRLREVLLEHDIFNRDLEKIVNKSEVTISRWVNNKNQPSLEDLYKIAEYLKIDIRELIHPTIWE